MPESEPVAAFGDTSFPVVTQPDNNASARHAEMITLFIVFLPSNRSKSLRILVLDLVVQAVSNVHSQ